MSNHALAGDLFDHLLTVIVRPMLRVLSGSAGSDDGDRIGHGSCPCLMYTSTSETSKAYVWFNKVDRPNLMPLFGVLSSTMESANACLTTGAGGLRQAAVFGFGGLRIDDSGVVRGKVALPTGWDALRIDRAPTVAAVIH